MLLFSQQYKTLEIGDKIPSIHHILFDTNKDMFSINDLKGSNGTLVIFTSNSCPFVVMWEDRYKEIEVKCSKNNIGMLYVNSNHAKRNSDDSFEKMKNHAKTMNYKYPYLLDEESYLANEFGAKTTPHIFLFNKDNKLSYIGSIDDNYKSSKNVKHHYLLNAITELKESKEIKVKETRAVGCSIKRNKK